MKSTAIFGGSFNPVHNGHVRLVVSAIEQLRPSRILIMPTHIAPHKQNKAAADDIHRLEMCRIAFADIHGTEVCDYEMRRRSVSYTVKTLEHFTKEYPDEKFYLIVGSDMLLTFDEWYRYRDIMRMASVVAAARENGSTDELEAKKNQLSEYGEVILLKIKPYPMSSTEIRTALSEGRDVSDWIDKGVLDYIKANRLYGCD